MECDYLPMAPDRFAPVLPRPCASVRIQTVDGAAPSRFRRLLDAFGTVSGMPVLVNTSFNGFREPIVCSPRDAVRVFYSTGIDMLVFENFVISK
jgi:carbamoyltransferase